MQGPRSFLLSCAHTGVFDDSNCALRRNFLMDPICQKSCCCCFGAPGARVASEPLDEGSDQSWSRQLFVRRSKPLAVRRASRTDFASFPHCIPSRLLQSWAIQIQPVSVASKGLQVRQMHGTKKLIALDAESTYAEQSVGTHEQTCHRRFIIPSISSMLSFHFQDHVCHGQVKAGRLHSAS